MRLFSPKEAWLKGVASLPTRWSPVVPPLGWMSFSPFGHEPRPPLSQVIVTLRPTLLPALLSLNFLLPHSSGSGRAFSASCYSHRFPISANVFGFLLALPPSPLYCPPPLRRFHRDGGGSEPHTRRGLREPALGQCRGCSLVCRGVPYAPRPRSRPFIPFILFKSFPRTRQGPLLHLTSPPTLLFPSHHSLCCLLRQFPLPFFSTHTRTGGCCFLPSLLEVSANPRHIAK